MGVEKKTNKKKRRYGMRKMTKTLTVSNKTKIIPAVGNNLCSGVNSSKERVMKKKLREMERDKKEQNLSSRTKEKAMENLLHNGGFRKVKSILLGNV